MVINSSVSSSVARNNVDDNQDPVSDHSKPSVRICRVDRRRAGNESGTNSAAAGTCGFHLTRTKWDPYPWIAGVDDDSPAQQAGLKVGDCVLEVNGEDLLGLRVGEIANKVQTGYDTISMLLWNSGSDANCDSESLCCTPMPTSLSRLSSCLSSILSFLECPICFEIISPPAHQCPLGHLICFRCRVYIERCPICRTNFTRERSLLADQIYNAVIEAFHLNNQTTGERTKKLWERIFGKKRRSKLPQPSSPTTKIATRATEFRRKFLTRLIGKSSSVDNLASESIFANSNESIFATSPLRKKSISSTDIYPESLKRLNYLYASSHQYSVESLPNPENGSLSRFSSTANSCETLNGGRNVSYYSRLRNRNLNDATENLFQFSTDSGSVNNDGDADVELPDTTTLFRCPLQPSCTPATAYSLLTHLQQHDGPVIQFFKPKFVVHFPFSFENTALFVVHQYEKIFFSRIHHEENNDIKIYVWIMDDKTEAENFQVKVELQADECKTNLKFKTIAHSIKSENGGGQDEEIYNHQILITDTTLRVYFREKFYSLKVSFKSREP